MQCLRSMAATASLPELPDRLVAQVAAEQPTRQDAAELANLRYVSDDEPGFSREIRGKRTIYRDPEGGVVRDAATLTRIRALVIPGLDTRLDLPARRRARAGYRPGPPRTQAVSLSPTLGPGP